MLFSGGGLLITVEGSVNDTTPDQTDLIYNNFRAEGFKYRLGPVNLNMVESKFHLIQTFVIILASFLSFQW